MSYDPEREHIPDPHEFWICERCDQRVRAGERDCPECGSVPCPECRQINCECDLLADDPPIGEGERR